MITLKSCLFGLFPIVAVALVIATNLSVTTVPTNDWRDLTVVGEGHICTVDESGENPIWLRSVRLGLNPCNVLCAIVDGEHRPIEPFIPVPSDLQSLSINCDGEIEVHAAGYYAMIGSLALTRFSGEFSDRSTIVASLIEKQDIPIPEQPGMNGTGILRQAMSNVYAFPLTANTGLALALACVPML